MAKTPSPKAAKPAVTKTVKKTATVKRENPAGNPTLHGDEPAKPAVTGLEGEAKVAQQEAAHEAAAPNPVVDETVTEKPEEETPSIPDGSEDFHAILADIKAGKEVTIEGEPGVYFRYEDNRLKKFSKQGGHMDSYPLYAFQERKGWALKK